MAKNLFYNESARAKLMAGIEKVADAVAVTLGPCGRNVMMQKNNSVIVSKDGVTVAKDIELEDPVENLGASLIKQVASKTNEVAGDNTTTSTVLARAIVKEGMKAVAAGMRPIEIKRGIDKATAAVIENLVKNSKPVETNEEITNVATISANNDPEIGKILADVVSKVGKDGVITVEESNGISTTVNVVEGMQIDNGWLNPNFCNNKERLEVNYDDCYILVTDKSISAMSQLLPILEPVAKAGKPLTIICDDMPEGEALGTIILNDIRGSLKVNVVKAPSFGDNKRNILNDVAILTGATIISDNNGIALENAKIEHLGIATVKSSKDSTIITKGNAKPGALQAHLDELKAQIENAKTDYDKNKLKARLARLTGGVAVVKVGAATEVELKEKKYRVEDTIAATKAALEEGIVPGGGVALLNASKLEGFEMGNDDFNRGANILLEAVAEPLKQIAENSGVNGEIILNKIYETDKDGYGYNAATGEYVDMMASGIIDTTKAIKNALLNAASVAGMILTTECTITDIPKKENNPLVMSPVGPLPM
jgi:chaperonin GroEL